MPASSVPKWLLKTEPSEFSLAQLIEAKRVVWDGISNPLALKNLRQIKAGETVLIYHTGDERQIVGTATCARAAYQDPSSRDPRSVVIDLEAAQALPAAVTLEQLKERPELATWDLVRQPRLSVVPVPAKAWAVLSSLLGR